MNIPLLRKIQAIIVQSPKEFSMESWHVASNGQLFGSSSEIVDLCGTIHCIAGWAEVLTNKDPSPGSTKNRAMEALRISFGQGERLFYGHKWPEGFGGYDATAQQASDRIDLFIKSGGTI